MTARRASTRRVVEPFGTGQHGGEPLDMEQGGRHGQPEKGDVARKPRQGGAGYRSRHPQGRSRQQIKKK